MVNVKGQGHIIDLDVDVPAGRIQDFLQLAVKTQPVVMTGVLTMKTKLHIRPGKESVTQKLGLKGDFTLKRMHFTNPALQDKVDMLSLRAQGDPKDAKPGAEDVNSHMTGKFQMGNGKLVLQDLNYTMPGATVQLAGVYTLDGKQFDFSGKVRTDAKLSQMVVDEVEELGVESSRSLLSQEWRWSRNPGESNRDKHRSQVRPGYRSQRQELAIRFGAR